MNMRTLITAAAAFSILFMSGAAALAQEAPPAPVTQPQDAPPPPATLQIRTSVQKPVNNAVSAFTIIALAKRLQIVSFLLLHTRLTITVGGKPIIYTQDGVKSIKVTAEDQDYQVSGSSDVAFTTRSRNGQIQSCHCTLTYLGDGTLSMSSTDAGKTLNVGVSQSSSKIVSNNVQTGESELEVTLGLKR